MDAIERDVRCVTDGTVVCHLQVRCVAIRVALPGCHGTNHQLRMAGRYFVLCAC